MSNEQKHTPGPVETLARVAMQRDDYGTDMDLRDAVDNVVGNPVYDAAPDLLEALTVLLHTFENHGSAKEQWMARHGNAGPAFEARAAIAKAKSAS